MTDNDPQSLEKILTGLNPDEIKTRIRQLANMLDPNHDSVITAQEMTPLLAAADYTQPILNLWKQSKDRGLSDTQTRYVVTHAVGKNLQDIIDKVSHPTEELSAIKKAQEELARIDTSELPPESQRIFERMQASIEPNITLFTNIKTAMESDPQLCDRIAALKVDMSDLPVPSTNPNSFERQPNPNIKISTANKLRTS